MCPADATDEFPRKERPVKLEGKPSGGGVHDLMRADKKTHLREILEELDGHVDEDLVLGDARLEARVHLEQLVDDLVLLALRVSLQRQHLSRLQMLLYL